MMIADGKEQFNAYDVGLGSHCSCQTATGLDAAAALRSPAIRSCSPPTLNIPARKTGPGHVVRGSDGTAGPRKASINTAIPLVYYVRGVSCMFLGIFFCTSRLCRPLILRRRRPRAVLLGLTAASQMEGARIWSYLPAASAQNRICVIPPKLLQMFKYQ